MTCIAAVTHRGRVTLGGDSCISTKSGSRWLSSSKVWRAGCFAIGVCGGLDYEIALRYRIKWPDAVEESKLEEHMLVSLPDELRDVFKRSGLDDASGGALIGVGGSLWEIHDCSPMRIVEPYGSVGSGYQVALGFLSAAPRTWGPRKRVESALDAAARHRTDVGPPFHFVVT